MSKLKIERPVWRAIVPGQLSVETVHCLNEWFDLRVNPINDQLDYAIERSQADKLAEALEWSIGFIEGATQRKDTYAHKVLKEYRGEDG